MLAFILSFALIFATTARANATTSAGGWTALDTITAGATNTINAVKGAGATGMRSAVTVAASAGKVGKHLIKGGGSVALAYAMVELADGAIDWVLDPANNAVKYKDPAVGGGNDGSVAGTVYRALWMTTQTDWHSSKTSACLYTMSLLVSNTELSNNWQFVGITGSTCNYSRVSGAYQLPLSAKQGVPEGAGVGSGDGYKYIPIDTVAAKVIANAEAGHAPSQEAVKATALEGFAAGEHDAALDAAAVPDTGVENPPDTENPPKDPDAPAEPFDPAGIISAINALKALLAGILSSITSLSDFFQSEPPADPKPEDTELDIPIPDVVPVDTDINFGGSCPANFEFNGSMFGNPINIVLLDTSKFCGFLSTFVKFPVYAASSLFALYILGGRKDV